MAVSSGASMVIWLRNFLIHLGLHRPDKKPAIIYQDNQATIKMHMGNAKSLNRTRHIDIHHRWISDYCRQGQIDLQYLPTNLMIADVLTKPLQGDLFKILTAQLLNTFNPLFSQNGKI